MIPVARKDDLVVQRSGEELLVFDMRTNKAVCLNKASALIWQNCDGNNSPFEIQQILQKELDAEISEDLVWFALEQLVAENLLTNEDPPEPEFTGLSRREIIRRIGMSSAVALPVVASLTAPQAKRAQSVACSPTCLCNGSEHMAGAVCGTTIPCTPSPCPSVCRSDVMGMNTPGTCFPT